MAEPEEENYYSYFVSDFSYAESIKNSLKVFLSTDTDYEKGTFKQITQGFTTFVNYLFQLKNPETVVMSCAVAYSLMTHWFNMSSTLSTEVSKMVYLFLDTTNVFETEIEYIMYVT